MKNYPHLFQEGKIGNMSVKNRIVMPAMLSNFGNASGEVTETMINYYTERAKGGIGLIIVENIQVDYPVGKNGVTQISCDDDRFLPGLNELAESCQQYGARIFGQIQHSGRQTTPIATQGLQTVGASDKPYFIFTPRALTTLEVDAMVEKFAQAASRIKRAGFDGVELHAAHGYLIGQFMSPFTNTRTDKYGGKTVKERCKFLLDIIKRARELCGNAFPLSVRISADEFIEGGNTLEDGKEIAKLLEEATADILHVSCGIAESSMNTIEPMSYEEGWKVYLAEAIKKEVHIPVIAVGKIRTPAMAESIIEQGRADFVAFGRQSICDPYFPAKTKEGREEDIIPCLSCNIGCVGGRMGNGLRVRCILNPVTGREKEYSTLLPAPRRKKVAVVGGGPGGMETARVASLRGHDVTLYEKSGSLGGQMNLAKLPPHKGKMEEAIQWFVTQIRKAGVEVKLNTEVTLSDVQNIGADVLVISTGGKPAVPKIPGIENARPAVDILTDEKPAGSGYVIIGGGMIGCETALFLVEKGIKDIAILEQLPQLATNMEPLTRIDALTRLAKAGVKSYTGALVTGIAKDGVTAEISGKREVIHAETILFAVGTEPVAELADAAAKLGKEFYLVGDCRDPYKQTQIMEAVFDGSQAGRLI
jgi:2,4-dienoyl-CoA reductase-like NADH-dependent reductase (Old Yellow Enzyme family)/thioredoxin reductase